MRIKCPECAKSAYLSDGFEQIVCEHCGYKASYGSYVERIAEQEAVYKDVLNDYR